MTRRLPVLAILVLVPTLARAAAPVVDAGALRAVVHVDPWRLAFVDAAGEPVLHEAPPAGAATPGPLGFRSGGAWAHATRAVAIRASGGVLHAVVETDDPLGRRLVVQMARDADGVIRVETTVEGGPYADVDAVGVAFVAAADERFFGLGERADGVEHRGAVVESHVSDGPYHPTDRQLIGSVLPPQGFRDRDDATYFPLPWLLSSRGHGVLVDGSHPVYHRLATDRPDAWSLEVAGAPVGLPPAPAPARWGFRVFAGPTPAEALRRFTARVGRQPRVEAPWVFGAWFQPGGPLAQQVEQVAGLRAAGVPVSVAQTYFHYLPCGGNRAGEPARTAALHALGVAVTTYFNPMVCEDYAAVFEPAAATGALVRTPAGAPYLYRYLTSRFFTVGQLDFTAPAGRRLWEAVLHDAIEDGHDGWMEDFGEYTPLDAVAADGTRGVALHNRYPVDYHCAAWAATRGRPRPIVRFQRSGWTGAARCATVVWSGDPTTIWDYDGLASVVATGLGMGLSGVSTWGSDIGGFFSINGKNLDGELLARWVQLGAVTPVMRTERDGIRIPGYVRPQVDDPAQVPNFRRWARFHTQLYPYLAAAERTYQRTGLPLMRHLALGWPEDPQAVATHDAYLFGPDLLAAPVLAPGVTARDVYLPAGEWVDLWRAVAVDSATGALVLGPAAALAGGRNVPVPAPADEVPLFVAPARCCPSCHPTSTRWPTTRWTTPRWSTCAIAPTSCTSSPFHAAGRRRARTGATACGPSRSRGRGRSRCTPTACGRGASRHRSRRCTRRSCRARWSGTGGRSGTTRGRSRGGACCGSRCAGDRADSSSARSAGRKESRRVALAPCAPAEYLWGRRRALPIGRPPGRTKRQKERDREERRVEKEKRKAERRAERERRGGAPGEDPDLAGIVPGPQPLPEEFGVLDDEPEESEDNA